MPAVCLTPMGSHAIPRHPVNRPRLSAAVFEFRSSGRGGFWRRGASWTDSSRISPTASTPRGGSRFPAPFRQALAKDGFEGVYAYPSLDAPALDCGGLKLLAEIDALLASLPPFSPARDAFATALLGTSEILRMDSEGRVTLDDRIKASLGLDQRSGVRRAGTQVPDLGAVAVRGASRGGAGAGAAPAGRAGRRGAGMTSDAPRHIPVLLAEVLEALDPRPGATIVDGTFGAGGYTRALLDRGADVVALDRDPVGDPRRRRSRRPIARTPAACRSAIRRSRNGGARPRTRIGRRRGPRRRRVVDAARRGRARVFAALRRAARHADGERGPFRRRHPARRGRGDDRRHPVPFRRGARRAPHRARHRRRPDRGAVRRARFSSPG